MRTECEERIPEKGPNLPEICPGAIARGLLQLGHRDLEDKVSHSYALLALSQQIKHMESSANYPMTRSVTDYQNYYPNRGSSEIDSSTNTMGNGQARFPSFHAFFSPPPPAYSNPSSPFSNVYSGTSSPTITVATIPSSDSSIGADNEESGDRSLNTRLMAMLLKAAAAGAR